MAHGTTILAQVLKLIPRSQIESFLVPCQPLPGLLTEKIVVRNSFSFKYFHGYSSPFPPQLPPQRRTGKVRNIERSDPIPKLHGIG